MQTFDLHAACHVLEDCPCPNHGTDECDCQMVMLLVFGGTKDPATLILHGHNRQTWLSICERARIEIGSKDDNCHTVK